MSKSDLIFSFSIDRGGTFTDIYCEISNKLGDAKPKQRVIKLLSILHFSPVNFIFLTINILLGEDPSNYNDAPTEGIRR